MSTTKLRLGYTVIDRPVIERAQSRLGRQARSQCRPQWQTHRTNLLVQAILHGIEGQLSFDCAHANVLVQEPQDEWNTLGLSSTKIPPFPPECCQCSRPRERLPAARRFIPGFGDGGSWAQARSLPRCSPENALEGIHPPGWAGWVLSADSQLTCQPLRAENASRWAIATDAGSRCHPWHVVSLSPSAHRQLPL